METILQLVISSTLVYSVLIFTVLVVLFQSVRVLLRWPEER